MKQYGLLGEKLGHSYSPQIHGMLADYEYRLYEVAREDVGSFLAETELGGMNVTIPYKKTVMEHCVWLSETAKKMGCVNTLVRRPDGWHGYNTDYYGFCSLVRQSGIGVGGKKALVLGSGGASNTVCRALEDLGAAEIVIISRSGENNYTNLERHRDAEVIVNTTPVGMYPHNGEAPLELGDFPRCVGVLDVVYNPARTGILLRAEELGIPHAGGLYMLVAQAKRSAELFTGTEIDDAKIDSITAQLQKQMENIILIGMPGCGKSSIGRRLAKALDRRFLDADAEIEKKAGKPIPEIFAEGGEERFRRLETEVLAELGKLSGAVIATGGGCVTRAENYPLLHQNGTIVWLRRELSRLPVEGRPISQSNPLEALYAQRKDRYAAFADTEIDNNRTPHAAVTAICERLG